ncbi:MAG: 50S ribosomal protein L20 [Candidatus Yanofskybacteria bacterium CG10_big_fil_rev_8_21_14_0_10_36_16]|uniref:Large ribosomal subunit protein bL20 n=1 Tax=Candidatus Yanofskybacteria bacterium CG10_big_fil_rev_8_21_14_0_10_36_16 TaxID=1975096 RepID=A0A2J0Q7Z1_9BACT|nr:MAG: 50S ribosomal protein L20 [Candidatus Yanofskybacteria bacterium CG10_big_fil_rev_8_21_14_0_10_36_16]
MPRVKRGTNANKRRKNLLKHAKGFKWGRKNKYRLAKDALYHAWSHQFNSRRKKKGDFRRLWQVQIGAASRELGMPYNKFINGLKKSSIDIDRKILANLAQKDPAIFQRLIEMSKTAN